MRKNAFGSLLLALACAGMTVDSRADLVTMDLTTVYDIGGSPTTTGNLTAQFQDISPGVVDMTLSVSGLAASYYNVNTWWFNLNPTYNYTLSFTPESYTAGMTLPSISEGASEAGNDGYFNLWYNGFNNNFVNGDSITYQITSSTTGLDALDFDNLDSPTSTYDPTGSYYSAAEIYGGDSGGTQVFYVGAETATVTTGVLAPDGGSTLAFLSLALGGLGRLAKKLRRV